MSASRKDRISCHFSVLSAVRLADREFFGCECQRFAVLRQPSEDEQSGSETASKKSMPA